MAKSIRVLQSYQEADETLRTLGEAERKIAAEKLAYERQMAHLKRRYEAVITPLKEQAADDQRALFAFVQANAADFVSPRSRELTWGKLGFRASTRVPLPRNRADLIVKLEREGLFMCVKTNKSVVSAEVSKLPTELLTKLDLKRVEGDSIFVEVKAGGDVR